MFVLMSGVPCLVLFFFFFQAEDGIRDLTVTGVQTCALPICQPLRQRPCRRCQTWRSRAVQHPGCQRRLKRPRLRALRHEPARPRSEEHTSELQSQSNLVCRLLLEKKKKKKNTSADQDISSDTNCTRHHE